MKPRYQRRINQMSIRPRFWVPLLLLCGSIVAIVYSMPIYPRNPRVEEVREAARPVFDALQAYRAQHNGEIPADLGALLAFMGRPLPGGMLPLDPWGHPLGYVNCAAEYKCAYVSSLGADNRPGGSGEDRDDEVIFDFYEN